MPTLESAFEFTADELALNQQGTLSLSQQTRLRQSMMSFWKIAGLITIVIIGITLLALALEPINPNIMGTVDSTARLIVIGFMMLVNILILLAVYDYRRTLLKKLKNHEVQTSTGHYTLEWQADLGCAHLTIRRKKFRLSRPQYDAIREHIPHNKLTIYYFDDTIVAVEPLAR